MRRKGYPVAPKGQPVPDQDLEAGSGLGLWNEHFLARCHHPLAGTIRFMLRVKLLEAGARAPVVAHPGEDLGYDLFALEGITLEPRATVKLRTGIAVEARDPLTGGPLGLLVRDRSSMAARGLATTGGVIDSGYRGEILVLMTNLGDANIELKAGEKIAQMVPVPVLTGAVEVVESLELSVRAEKGFGSSGK